LCAAIELVGTDDRIEIASMADIPAGTGLGSSGSFTTALLRALHTRQRNVISPHPLAEQACHIEIDLLCEPVGKDQFIAAYGGVTSFEFNKDDSAAVNAQLLATRWSTTSRMDSVFSSPAIHGPLRPS
jgi:galactokinase/mevalonate kinase-like predicted kinase